MERVRMERAVRHANIVNYKRQLLSPADETQRCTLLTLLVEEEAKEIAANVLARAPTA